MTVNAVNDRSMNRLVLPIAIACGLGISWVDASPGWDDTGITAGALLLTSGIIALVAPRRVWLIALAVGVWIPLHGIVNNGDPKILLVLLFPLAGAYGGLGIRKLAEAGNAAAQ